MRVLFFLSLLWMSTGLTACPKTTTTLTPAERDTAREVFNKHLIAIGASPQGIPHTALKMTGSLEYFGDNSRNNFTIEQRHPNHYYIRISLAGTGVFERGHDGETFWERTPRESRILDKSEQLKLQPIIDFQRWANHQEWYPTITNLETAEFGGEPCDVITAINHLGTTERLFFVQSSGLLVGIEQLGDTNAITRYGQYLIHNDIKVPTYWEDKRGDVHRIWK